MTKDSYRNIQGRRAGKATRDLHYTQRTFAGRQDYKFKLTNSERNLFKKIHEENMKIEKNISKQRKSTYLIRLVIILKRFFDL